jgi:hypothetical protein
VAPSQAEKSCTAGCHTVLAQCESEHTTPRQPTSCQRKRRASAPRWRWDYFGDIAALPLFPRESVLETVELGNQDDSAYCRQLSMVVDVD